MRLRRAVIGPVIAFASIAACGHGGASTPEMQTALSATAPTSPSAKATPAATQSATPAATSDNWPTYHRDNARTGLYAGLAKPTTLITLVNKKLDGAVYAEPIVVNGHLIVATENNTLYAFNASTGALFWQRHLASPVSRSSLPCGNIDPEGITGTPAYDSATNRVFVVAEQQPGVQHVIYGLDLDSGAVMLHRSADPPNQSATPMQERGALLVAHSRVYWTFGGLAGDCGDYHGHVVSVPTSGSGAMTFWRVPTPREGGLWAPPGPSLGSDGNLYVSVGNGESTTTYDGSDSVVELNANLQRVGFFAPTVWQDDNAADLDLGSLGPTPVGQNVFIAGKRGTGYLLRQNALGGIGGQIASHTVCKAFGGTAHVASSVFVPCTDGLRLVRIGTNDFTVGWKSASNITGSPVVSRGAIWSLDPSGGTLYMLNPTTGQVVLSHSVGTTTRFATPTIWQDKIFVGTTTGIVALKAS